MFRKTLSLVMALSLFAMPVYTFAQQTSDAAQAIMDAERDADQANTFVWIGVGILCGIFGIPIAYLAEPSVNPMKLVGKSPEYVVYYTNTYKQKVKKEQTLAATGGCLMWSLAYVLVIYSN